MTAPTAGGTSATPRGEPVEAPPPATGYNSTMTSSHRWRVGDGLWTVTIALTKALTVAFGIDALINHRSDRLRGKAIRTRAFGYVGGLFIVPVLWRLFGRRETYPRALDLAVTTPLLLDAGGNAFGLYERAHIDDVVHVANSAILAGVAGAVLAPHVDEPWQAALAAAGISIAAGSAWEIWEYAAYRLGADGMNLTYDDTMADLAEGFVGAGIGALFALTRAPRSRAVREREDWRAALGA
jgi:hypothetical protein